MEAETLLNECLSEFRKHSYGYYAATNFRVAQKNFRDSEFEHCVVQLQQSIECSLKAILSMADVRDMDLLHSHKVLRLATKVYGETISKRERTVFRLLGNCYFELRYPVDNEDEIDDELYDLDAESDFIQDAFAIASHCLEDMLSFKHQQQGELKQGISNVIEELKLY